MIRLRLHAPEREPVEMGFDDPVIGIGRDPGNHLVVDDQRASRYHCQIERENGQWKVVDNASANGTQVNGDTINFRHLTTGDRIAIGETQIEVLEFSAGAATRKGTAAGRGRASRRQRPVEEGEAAPRTRRVRARSSSAPQVGVWLLAIVLAVAIGVMLVRNEYMQQSHANSVQAAESAMKEARFEDALRSLDLVPASSRHYDAALSLRKKVKREFAKFKVEALEMEAEAAFKNLEGWLEIKDITYTRMQGYVDSFLDRYSESSYADRARGLLLRVPRTGEGEDPGTETPSSGDPAATDTRSPFQKAMEEADRYLAKQQYGAAIETLSDFWSNNAGDEADRANSRVSEIRAEADRAWEKLKGKVDTALKADEKEKALELLWKADGFGIESISEAARLMAREIEKRR